MKYASVCSGVEAASLAWMPLGWEAAWFSEIEPFPCAVLKERFPNVPNLGDMTKIKVENLENGDQRFTSGNGADVIVHGGVDLLVGGTPCQGFSVAGKQGGLEDDRSVLCLTFCQLLADMRPKWFVWENVPGVFSTAGGEDFKAFIRKIDEVGYHVAWRVLDAQYVRVDGFPRAVPQRRRRVFVVGHLDGWEYPAEVLFEPHSLFGNTPPCRVKGKGFTADAERSVGTASRPWDSSGVNPTLNQCNGSAVSIGNGQVDGLVNPPELAQTLNCMHDQQAVMCLNDQGGSVLQVEQDGNAGGNTVPEVVCYDNQTRARNPEPTGNVSGTIQAFCGTGGGNVPLVQCYENHAQDSRVKNLDGVCSQISANAGMGGGNLPLVQECYSVDRRNQTLDTEVSNTLNTCNGGDNYNTVMESIAFEPGITKRMGGHSRFAKEVSGTLRRDMGDNQTAVAIAENIIGRQIQNGGNGTGAQEELAYTQNTSGVMGVANHATVRRLLPIETERLMGFPDNWTRIPWKGKPENECPDSPRYKACGNSMCVNVMRWIGMRIETVERRINWQD